MSHPPAQTRLDILINTKHMFGIPGQHDTRAAIPAMRKSIHSPFIIPKPGAPYYEMLTTITKSCHGRGCLQRRPYIYSKGICKTPHPGTSASLLPCPSPPPSLSTTSLRSLLLYLPPSSSIPNPSSSSPSVASTSYLTPDIFSYPSSFHPSFIPFLPLRLPLNLLIR